MMKTTRFSPSYFANIGIPSGGMGSLELERDAYLYATALAKSGDVWRIVPFLEAKALLLELEECEGGSPRALDWDQWPLTLGKAMLVWGIDATEELEALKANLETLVRDLETLDRVLEQLEKRFARKSAAIVEAET